MREDGRLRYLETRPRPFASRPIRLHQPHYLDKQTYVSVERSPRKDRLAHAAFKSKTDFLETHSALIPSLNALFDVVEPLGQLHRLLPHLEAAPSARIHLLEIAWAQL